MTRVNRSLCAALTALLPLIGVSGPALAADAKTITLTLLQVEGHEPSDAHLTLSEIQDGDLIDLRLTMPVGPDAPLYVRGAISDQDAGALEGADRTASSLTATGCAFGLVEGLTQIDAPTLDNHLIMTIHLAPIGAVNATVVYCEYGLGVGDVEDGVLTVRGCFSAISFSIPTAQAVELIPMPLTACRS